MRFSGLTFIRNDQNKIFKSQECLRYETVEELHHPTTLKNITTTI